MRPGRHWPSSVLVVRICFTERFPTMSKWGNYTMFVTCIQIDSNQHACACACTYAHVCVCVKLLRTAFIYTFIYLYIAGPHRSHKSKVVRVWSPYCSATHLASQRPNYSGYLNVGICRWHPFILIHFGRPLLLFVNKCIFAIGMWDLVEKCYRVHQSFIWVNLAGVKNKTKILQYTTVLLEWN